MTQQPQPDAAFVPPAAEGLPDGALDSAIGGACHLDARADTPYGRNVLAHALLGLQRDGWLKDTPAGRNDTTEPLADRIADAFERLDAHQWGYDHGFCGTYGTDPETDSFVDAALTIVQPELDQRDAEIRRLTFEHERACGQLLHFAAEAHRRKWTYDTGDEGPTPDAFAVLHQLGNDIKAALDKLTNPAQES